MSLRFSFLSLYLISFCGSILNLKLSYIGIVCSSIFMLLYKLSYNVKDIYDLSFSENIYIYILTFITLYIRQGALMS